MKNFNRLLSNCFLHVCLIAIFFGISGYYVTAQTGQTNSFGSPVKFINTNFENATGRLVWEYNPDGSVLVQLMNDHERNTPNRSTIHVHFQVQAKAEADVILHILYYDDDVYNGRLSAVSPYTYLRCYYVSDDGVHWKTVPVEKLERGHKIKVHMNTDILYVTSMEPYRISDLDQLLNEIQDHPLVKIEPIGKTVEGRRLEIVCIGNPAAPFRVFIRGRAHPWESGTNWVVQGLIKSLLDKNENNDKYFNKYCVYILPMANKDGVARGYTRFNSLGMDLNRNMNRPADPDLLPENHAMETWLKMMIYKGMKPQIAIDLHNHQGAEVVMYGHPNIVKREEYKSDGLMTLQNYFLIVDKNANTGQYDSNVRKFESLICQHTWYKQTESNAKNYPVSPENAAVPRYDVDFACVLELSHVWIERLNKAPFSTDWMLFGKQLREVFYHYFDSK